MGFRVHRDEIEGVNESKYHLYNGLFTSCARSQHALSSFCSKIPASGFRLLDWDEDKVVLEELKGFPVWKPSAPRFLFVIYDLQILLRSRDPISIARNEGTYHDQRFLYAKHSVARKPFIAFRVKGGYQLPITGGLD